MAPWGWFPCKPKHVGAVLLILKCFNNSKFFNVVCIGWKLKCWILLLHGVALKLHMTFLSTYLTQRHKGLCTARKHGGLEAELHWVGSLSEIKYLFSIVNRTTTPRFCSPSPRRYTDRTTRRASADLPQCATVSGLFGLLSTQWFCTFHSVTLPHNEVCGTVLWQYRFSTFLLAPCLNPTQQWDCEAFWTCSAVTVCGWQTVCLYGNVWANIAYIYVSGTWYVYAGNADTQTVCTTCAFLIQSVPWGMDKTSGECSLCWTIPI